MYSHTSEETIIEYPYTYPKLYMCRKESYRILTHLKLEVHSPNALNQICMKYLTHMLYDVLEVAFVQPISTDS